MKKICAYIKTHRMDKVIAALHELPRFPGFTVLDGHGQGHGRGAGGHYAFGQDGLLYHSQRLLVVICEDHEMAAVVDTLATAAHSGRPGDGLITVEHMEAVLRIRDAGDRT